ncbi:MAG: ABC transporter ATP-binding protein, partial [Clostridia bacterium]|nr:ABC transporter ATP-binding protein [Clostridia bacterium]
ILCFGILIGFGLLGMAFSFAAQWFAAKASVGFAANLRQAMFDHIQRLSYTELDSAGTDTLITRMTSDINQVQNGLNLALRLLLRSPFIVLGAVIMAFTVDVKSALIFAAVLPVLSIIVFGIMYKSIPLLTKSQKALDKLTGKTRENLSGVRVIRAFNKEKAETDEFDEANAAVTKLNVIVGRLNALMNPATYLVINIATIVLIYVGALRVDGGAIAQGDLVALYNYMAQIVVELIKLASLIISINKALACGKRISAMLDIESSMNYKNSALPEQIVNDTAIEFENVTFSYKGSGDSAIENIGFCVGRGQTVGVIGGTGSGKTTLVDLIPRFYDATSGRVLIHGIDVKDYPEGELIKRVGVVPQSALLFKGSIRENMLWGKSNATDEEIWEALEAAQAAEVVKGKENGLDHIIEQGGRNLSGGQRQRLTIARALVKKPEILILDDSASALDFATDLKLRRAIERIKGSMTVILVSQRTSSVRNADKILVMDDGKLVGDGTHTELMQSCDVYKEIYYSQFPEEVSAK